MTAWQKKHFIDELQRNGHCISLFDKFQYKSIDDANDKLLSFVRKQKIQFDLFINSFGKDTFYISSIKEINRMGIPSLLICFDNLQVPYMHQNIAKYFNMVWLTSWETENIFKKWGVKTIFMPYAANPHTFTPDFSEEIKSVGFIGTPYGTRIDKINALTSAEIPVSLYSDRFVQKHTESIVQARRKKTLADYNSDLRTYADLIKFPIGRKIFLSKVKKAFNADSHLNIDSSHLNCVPSVSFEEMNYLYSNLALSLGITELWETYVLENPIHKLHLRTFEIPMCGGLQLVSYTDELAEYFEDQKEIILYKSKEEYIDKAKYYLDDKRASLRMKMKRAARERSVGEHTWIHRFNKIFQRMGLK